jgi:hypothetical protein
MSTMFTSAAQGYQWCHELEALRQSGHDAWRFIKSLVGFRWFVVAFLLLLHEFRFCLILLDVLVKSGWSPTYNGHLSFDVFFWVNGPQFKTVGRNVHAHTQTPRSFESSYGHVCVRDAGMFTYRPAAKCTHKLGPKQHSRELTKKKMIQSCELNLHLRISGSEIHSWQMCWLNVLPGI